MKDRERLVYPEKEIVRGGFLSRRDIWQTSMWVRSGDAHCLPKRLRE